MPLNIPNIYPQQPGGDIVTGMRGINALSNDMLDNQIKGAQAQYAPWTAYADAASKIAYKNMLPYQIQATILSNPLMWMALKDNPQALNSLVNNFKNSIPDISSMSNNGSMPPPPIASSRGDGILSKIVNFLSPNASNQSQSAGGNNIFSPNAQQGSGIPTPISIAPTNSQMTPQSNDNAALVPASKGSVSGIIGKETAGYQESPYTPGKTVATDTGNISVPTGQSVDTAQQAILGIENLKPILNNISLGADKFLAPGEKGKLALAQTMNYLEQHFGGLGGIPEGIKKQLGITDKDISEYAAWKADQKKAVETIMKARNWPQDQRAIQAVEDIIAPIPGEGKEYGARIARELASLENDLLPNVKQTLKGGYNLSSSSSNVAQSTPSNTAQSPSSLKAPTEQDWINTAKKHGKTVEQVKKELGSYYGLTNG